MYGTELRRSGRGTAQHRKIRRHLMKTLLQGWNGQPYFPRRKIKPPQTHLTQCRQRLEPGGKQNSVLLCCAEGSGPCTQSSPAPPPPRLRAGSFESSPTYEKVIPKSALLWPTQWQPTLCPTAVGHCSFGTLCSSLINTKRCLSLCEVKRKGLDL